MSYKTGVIWVLLLISTVAPASVVPDATSMYLPGGGGAGDHYTPIGSPLSPGETVIPGVPAYLWRHGCGPTAAGMVFGYWDMHGFPNLIPGDSSTQTEAVNQAIASDQHYEDYALPLDNPSTGLLLDKSCDGEAHESNSIADFMMTSWAITGNYYGWSSFTGARRAFTGYTDYVNATTGSAYIATVSSRIWGVSGFNWSQFVSQIDSRHPVLLLVDSSGDGTTDHFVPAIGYRQTNGYNEYALYDTWSNTQIRWERFWNVASGQPWGIYGAIFYDVTPEPSTALMLILVVLTSTRRVRRIG